MKKKKKKKKKRKKKDKDKDRYKNKNKENNKKKKWERMTSPIKFMIYVACDLNFINKWYFMISFKKIRNNNKSKGKVRKTKRWVRPNVQESETNEPRGKH